MHVSTLGSGPRVVLVHGSVGNGAATWSEQHALADRFELIIPDRPGFPPNPLEERVDFEEQAPLIADLLGDGAHLPKLVVSGAHSAAFDAVCDVLERELGAERAVRAGAGHSIPRAPGFTELLADWLAR